MGKKTSKCTTYFFTFFLKYLSLDFQLFSVILVHGLHFYLEMFYINNVKP